MPNQQNPILRKEFSPLREQMLPTIQRLMKRNSITGISLALVDGAEIAWAEGFGYADKESGVPATQETIYKIGSITKLFTAAAAMQMVEEGKIDLDRPVRSYLPGFSIHNHSTEAGPITVRSLMTHHSGLPADNLHGFYAAHIENRPEPYQSVLGYLKHTYAAYPPETLFSYSNLGLDVLGAILERVAGERYEDYLEENILEPLRMDCSFVWPEPPTQAGLSKGYHRGKGIWEPMLRDIPAGGLHSTAVDMAHFIAMALGQGVYRGARILQKETLESMWEQQNSAVPLDFNFSIGLNWILSRPALAYAGKVCWHDGGTQHFHSQLVLLPDQNLGVVVLSNSDTAGEAAFHLADEVLQQAVQLRKGLQPPAMPAHPLARGSAGRPGDLEGFVGEYPTIGLGMLTLKTGPQGAALVLKGQALKLIPQRDGWYRPRFHLFGLLPLPLKQLETLRVHFDHIGGEQVLAIEQQGLQTAIAKRYTRQPVPPELLAAAGTYRNINPDDLMLKNLQLKAAGDLLWVEGSVYKMGNTSIYLHPVSADQALTLGLGRRGNETVFFRQENGKRTMELMGMVFEKE